MKLIAVLDGDKINKKERRGGSGIGWHTEDVGYTLTAKDRHGVVYVDTLERTADRAIPDRAECRGGQRMPDKENFNAVLRIQEKIGTLSAGAHPSGFNGQDAYQDRLITEERMEKQYTVRRLTPLECERLQGFPDNWSRIGEPVPEDVTEYEIETDENGDVISKVAVGSHKEEVWYYTDENGKRKKVSDSSRYRLQGNSIALPFWSRLIAAISATYGEDYKPTMASLFDGQGGFPLLWEHINGKGTAVWASEIEPYAIAVTKWHFPEEEE